MFLLGVFLLLILSVLWRINATNFFDWLFVDGEKLCQKKTKNQYDNKEIQYGLQLINYGIYFSSSGIKPIYSRNICRSTF